MMSRSSRSAAFSYEDAGVVTFDYGEHLAVMDMTGWEAHNWVEKWRLELYGATRRSKPA